MWSSLKSPFATFALILVCGGGFVRGQALTTAQHNEALNRLNARDKVDYVIKNFYQLYSADFDNAVAWTTRAAELARAQNWKDKEAYCLMYRGVVHALKGQHENALPHYLQAYQLFDSLRHYDGLARLCNEIGMFYVRQRDLKKAHAYLDEGETYCRKANNMEELGTLLGTRATLLEREGKTAEAHAMYYRVYEIRLQQKDSVGLGYVLLDLSNIALSAGDFAKAIAYIEESTAIRKKIGDRQGVVVNVVNTGDAFFSVGDYRTSARHYHNALPQAVALGYTDLVRYIYSQLTLVAVSLNDYKSAYAYQARAHALQDSLFNLEKTKVIAALQTKYETEKKEQQIRLQQAEIMSRDADLRQTYIVIVFLVMVLLLLAIIFVLVRNRFGRERALLREKNALSVREAFIEASIQSQELERKRFAQDLHDGMGQLISALRLSLNSVNANTGLEDRIQVVARAEKLLNDMHREIRSIAFNLMPHTLVQYGLSPALREMAERINHSGAVIVRVSAFEVPERLTEVQEISVYRIIQEWINNVIKYANATIIEVQLVGFENEINVTVEDNGAGFDPRLLETGAGNGWKNIQSRLNLLRGTLDIDSTPARMGTTFSMRVPLAATGTPVYAGKARVG